MKTKYYIMIILFALIISINNYSYAKYYKVSTVKIGRINTTIRSFNNNLQTSSNNLKILNQIDDCAEKKSENNELANMLKDETELDDKFNNTIVHDNTIDEINNTNIENYKIDITQ